MRAEEAAAEDVKRRLPDEPAPAAPLVAFLDADDIIRDFPCKGCGAAKGVRCRNTGPNQCHAERMKAASKGAAATKAKRKSAAERGEVDPEDERLIVEYIDGRLVQQEKILDDIAGEDGDERGRVLGILWSMVRKGRLVEELRAPFRCYRLTGQKPEGPIVTRASEATPVRHERAPSEDEVLAFLAQKPATMADFNKHWPRVPFGRTSLVLSDLFKTQEVRMDRPTKCYTITEKGLARLGPAKAAGRHPARVRRPHHRPRAQELVGGQEEEARQPRQGGAGGDAPPPGAGPEYLVRPHP
jgi:hypothetical protein